MKFIGHNPFIKQLRTDKGWRVEIDVSEDQFDVIKNLPKLQDQVLEITIEEMANERLNHELPTE